MRAVASTTNPYPLTHPRENLFAISRPFAAQMVLLLPHRIAACAGMSIVLGDPEGCAYGSASSGSGVDSSAIAVNVALTSSEMAVTVRMAASFTAVAVALACSSSDASLGVRRRSRGWRWRVCAGVIRLRRSPARRGF